MYGEIDDRGQRLLAPDAVLPCRDARGPGRGSSGPSSTRMLAPPRAHLPDSPLAAPGRSRGCSASSSSRQSCSSSARVRARRSRDSTGILAATSQRLSAIAFAQRLRAFVERLFLGNRAALAGPREAPRIWRAAPRPSSSSLSSARAAQASSLRRPPRSGRLPARSSSVSISRPRPPSLLVEPLFEWKERSARLPRPPDVPRGPPHPLLSPLSPLPVPLPVLTRTPSLRSTRM